MIINSKVNYYFNLHPYKYVVPKKNTNLQEIRQSMSKLYGRKLVPFLSPMLEDDLGKKVPAEVGNKIHERNFNKIKECIDMVAQHVNPGDRAIAIKLTAFMPIELLVCFSLFRCVERFLLYILVMNSHIEFISLTYLRFTVYL